MIIDAPENNRVRARLHQQLYVWVLVAIVLGIVVGWLFPAFGTALKPLGDAFIKLVKMIITPVIFLTVVTGIAGIGELRSVGRVIGKAMAYFVSVSTLALLVGMAVANVLQPGSGMHIDPATLDGAAIAEYTAKAHDQTLVGFLMHILPDTLLSGIVGGDVLQTLFVSILVAVTIILVGRPAAPALAMLESLSQIVFRLVALLMYTAPIGAFGAMAFTVGRYGIGSLSGLVALVATFYLTSIFFVVVVLGVIARLAGFSIGRLLRYLKAELLLVLGTSSSEAALPSLIAKMERAGVSKSVVGIVVPTGYSFNLDGTNIYMTLAALFIAQACGIDLSLTDQLLLLGIAMLSSKGAAGVAGAGFITLAATLSIVPSVPIAGMALILGVDRFMSQCRSLTNFIGNAVATVVIARWEDELDEAQLHAALSGAPMTEPTAA